MFGYLEATSRLEGYRFHIIRKGIGCVNDKVLCDTPYGLFGADRLGMWLLDNRGQIRRISDGVIDIKTSGKSTALAQADITDSFITWCPQTKEALWCIRQAEANLVTNGTFATDTGWTKGNGWGIAGGVASCASGYGNLEQDVSAVIGHIYKVKFAVTAYTSGTLLTQVGGASTDRATATGTYCSEATATSIGNLLFGSTPGSSFVGSIDNVEVYDVTDGVQIVYQANRGLFAGPYNHPVIGGTNFVSTGGAQAYFNNLSGTGKDMIAPSSPTVAQELQFWFGQSSLETVKDDVLVEVIYKSVTADKNVTATVYQNNIASTTGAVASGDFSHSDDNLVGKIKATGSGRMILVKLVIPSDCSAPVITVGYYANFVPWEEKSNR